MSSDAFDKFFRAKYDYLNEWINKFDGASAVMDDNRVEKHMLTISSALLRNIKDLYFIHEVSLEMQLRIRDDLNQLKTRTGQTEQMATQLSERMDSTLGTLEKRLKEINEQDAQDRQKMGDTTFYG